MNKGKAWGLALVAFFLGLILGWLLWRNAAGPVPAPLPPMPTVLSLPTTTVGDVRFTVFRAGKSQTRDEAGTSRWLRTFEIVIENLKNPDASMDSLELGPVILLAEGKPLAAPVRTKMNDKFTLPPGLPPTVSENARVLSCFQEIEEPTSRSAGAGSASAQTGPATYSIKLTYGPSEIPVTLGPLTFP